MLLSIRKYFTLFILGLSFTPVYRCEGTCSAKDIETPQEFFARENELLRQRRHEEYSAAYAYNTNVTETNRQAMIAIATKNSQLNKELAQRINNAGYTQLKDEYLKRQAVILADLGQDVLPENEFKELQNAISAMQTNYATATVCPYKGDDNCKLTLEPHIQERLSNSRDPKELEHYWVQWHNKAGTPMRENFKKYIEYTRKAAKMNGYASNADYWIHFYEDDDFEKNLDATYNAILPFYREVHAYVRHKLRQHYGDNIVSETGPIPMHLLGNMWAQQWDEAIELYTPYPEQPFIDVTAELKQQKYTVKRMFELGDEFFKSLNLIPLPKTFWERSVLTRPTDRQIVCHASAWDLFDNNSDVRIKMCTEIDKHYLYVVHHELGHIQYYLQYEKQPTAFRNCPNPGFHEAVGDVIALSVTTPKHLKRIGLLENGDLVEKSRINELFVTALKKIVFLPFAYTMDKYRYAVFRNEIEEKNWNTGFWEMRSTYTGVEPPVVRTENDFDPPAKYHIDADVEYLRYFAAHIFQFQFHKALCIKAGQYNVNSTTNSLDNCDIYESKEAGDAFRKFLSIGASKHWKDVLYEFTGETTMDPTALLEYFKPLHDWLKKENERLGVHIGWTSTNKIPKNK